MRSGEFDEVELIEPEVVEVGVVEVGVVEVGVVEGRDLGFDEENLDLMNMNKMEKTGP